MRRTKVVCTLGPASREPGILRELMLAGMDVARLNFSHGTRKEKAEDIDNLRRLSAELERPLAILADLQGPRIRVGDISGGEVILEEGAGFTLTTRPIEGNREVASVSFAELPGDVSPGDNILIDSGLLKLRVEGVRGSDILCRVVVGGRLRAHRGMNLPDVSLSMDSITEKDEEDLKFALTRGVDWVAMSFVRSAADVARLKKLVAEEGSPTLIVAKVERRGAVENIDEILEVADGVMVARGDLGVEMSAEEVPLIQKRVIGKAMKSGKPVITATQMLESMLASPRPTRAEASDVANAIFDGTDALMLSGETAVGSYPVEAVRTMATIAEKTESFIDYAGQLIHKSDWVKGDVSDAISFAACELAADLGVGFIVTATQSGSTARRVSRYRPPAGIVAVSPEDGTVRQLTLSWGVIPLLVPPSKDISEVFDGGVKAVQGRGLVTKGDRVVITAGVLVNVPGTTDIIKVQEVE
ncbi:MAG TPA: pyruvate kinase [Actinobacteria bacterium]|nr:pyruvate kinase [Actinomycetota bacterium]